MNETLVKVMGEGRSEVHLRFQGIQPDLIRLSKVNYVRTKRDSTGAFQHQRRLLSGNENFIVAEPGNRWRVDHNFPDTHEWIEWHSCWRAMLNGLLECVTCGRFSREVDFPGFVALLEPNEQCPYYLIVVVLRGSQDEDFQPGSGLLGANWATNFDVTLKHVLPNELGFQGRMHAGYMTKVRSFNFSQEQLAGMVQREEIENPLRDQGLERVYTRNHSIEF
jgi:hypothetical protein